MDADRIKIIITVSGGLVCDVHTDSDMEFDVEVADYDLSPYLTQEELAAEEDHLERLEAKKENMRCIY